MCRLSAYSRMNESSDAMVFKRILSHRGIASVKSPIIRDGVQTDTIPSRDSIRTVKYFWDLTRISKTPSNDELNERTQRNPISYGVFVVFQSCNL